jgi:GT2 family glycosyltransferase
MDLSIIIVNWNTRDLLKQCLLWLQRSLHTRESSDVPASRPFGVETFVVDNASTDASVSMVRDQFPWVRLIKNPENVGFARANNQALRVCRGRYVLLLNSDTELRPGALAALFAFMAAHPGTGACGPRLLNADGTLQISCHPLLTPWREFWRLVFLDRLLPLATYPLARWDTAQPHQVEVLKGACLMLRRDALDQVGLLDERYFMYTEEMDLCCRLLQAGWDLYWVPRAEVVHHGEASTRQVAEDMYIQLYRSKVQFHRKFGGQARSRLFKIFLALAYLPRWAFAALGQAFRTDFALRSRTYRRLLAELPTM